MKASSSHVNHAIFHQERKICTVGYFPVRGLGLTLETGLRIRIMLGIKSIKLG